MSVKKQLAVMALNEIPKDIILGLGTGTTVEACIDVLAEQDYRHQGYVFSSTRTMEYAKKYALTGVMLNEAMSIDIYIDGTDEIDKDFIPLKGAGGAMTGEMLCARMARIFWVLAEERKKVDRLGESMPLPVELVTWAQSHFARYIVGLGGSPVLRSGLSELGNPIIDCHNLSFAEPYALAKSIEAFPGVISHGLFVRNRPEKIILGNTDKCWVEESNLS